LSKANLIDARLRFAKLLGAILDGVKLCRTMMANIKIRYRNDHCPK